MKNWWKFHKINAFNEFLMKIQFKFDEDLLFIV